MCFFCCQVYNSRSQSHLIIAVCGENTAIRFCAIYSFFLDFNLIKTAAKFMRNESVKCPARAVFAKSRARHVHIMSLNLLTSHLNYSIKRVSYVHSSRTNDESLHYFVLPSEKQNAFARSADFEFQLILYLGPNNFGSEIVLKN